MRLYKLILLVFLLAACSPSIQSQPEGAAGSEPVPDLPDLGEAPELANDVWLNTDKPLRLVDLRGKVVLLDMWTFG